MAILAPSWNTFLTRVCQPIFDSCCSQVVSSELPRSACLSCLLPPVAARRRLLPLDGARRNCGLLRAAACRRSFSPLVASCRCASHACCRLLLLVVACCRLSPFVAACRCASQLPCASRRRLLPFVAACCRLPLRSGELRSYTQSHRNAAGVLRRSVNVSALPVPCREMFKNGPSCEQVSKVRGV